MDTDSGSAPRRKGCFRSGCFLFLLLFFIGFLAVTAGGVILVCHTLSNDGEEEEIALPEKKNGTGKIAVIPLDGVIAYSQGYSSSASADPDVLEKMFSKAEKDSSIKGVILSINSPGGEVTAGDDIYRMILDFRERTGKPVVGLMNSLAASGGLYAAMGCEKILASPMTITGSIGVIVSTCNVHDLAEWLGVHREVYASGKMKDMLDPMKKRTEEEAEITQKLVEENYLRFVRVVSRSRKIPEEKILHGTIGDGRILSAQQALDAGLIDGFGRMKDACALVEKLAKVPKNTLNPVRYKRKFHLWDMLMESSVSAGKVQVVLPGRKEIRGGGYLYFLSPVLIP